MYLPPDARRVSRPGSGAGGVSRLASEDRGDSTTAPAHLRTLSRVLAPWWCRTLALSRTRTKGGRCAVWTAVWRVARILRHFRTPLHLSAPPLPRCSCTRLFRSATHSLHVPLTLNSEGQYMHNGDRLLSVYRNVRGYGRVSGPAAAAASR